MESWDSHGMDLTIPEIEHDWLGNPLGFGFGGKITELNGSVSIFTFHYPSTWGRHWGGKTGITLGFKSQKLGI